MISVSAKLIFAIRVVLAAVWFYNGLWLKVIAVDPHHLEIVSSIASGGIDPLTLMRMIGGCETLLAIGILSGLFHRFVNYFQIAIVLAMNIIGIMFGGDTIPNPAGLIISNLPLVMCALVVALEGPGAYALTWNKPGGRRQH